jgi:pimeloyl-ACP methyl ester carboxylesterase
MFGKLSTIIKGWFKSLFKPKYILNYKTIAGPGQQIIFLHGLASKISVWKYVYEPLRGKHNILLLDLLGFGRSPQPNDCRYTADDQVDAIVATLKKLGKWEPSYFVTHSMGGIVATRLASRYPDKVLGMVLCSPPFYKRAELNDQKLLEWQNNSDELYFKAYRRLRSNPDWAIKGSAMLKKLNIRGMDVTEQNWMVFHESLKNTIEQQHAISDISTLRVPIKIIYGRFDVLVNSSNISRLAKKLPNISLLKVNTGHDLNMGYSKIIAREIDNFVISK